MPTPREIRQKAIRDAEEFIRRHLWSLEEATVKSLYRLYQDAYGSLSVRLFQAFPAGSEKWTAADLAFRQRTEALMAQIEDESNRLLASSVDTAFSSAAKGYQAGFYGRGWVLDQGIRGTGVAIPLLPTEAIRAAILQPYIGSTFLDRFRDARDEFVQRIRKSIVGSQIEGEGIRQAQKRLAGELGIDISKRLNKGLFARTEMIARTEILRSSNLGSMAVYEANQDVLEGWEFQATKDERTCEECGPLDGKRYAFGEGDAPPIHPQCRCTQLPVLINSALQDRIAGPRVTYSEWAQGRGLGGRDGGVMELPGRGAPKSSTVEARRMVYQGA